MTVFVLPGRTSRLLLRGREACKGSHEARSTTPEAASSAYFSSPPETGHGAPTGPRAHNPDTYPPGLRCHGIVQSRPRRVRKVSVARRKQAEPRKRRREGTVANFLAPVDFDEEIATHVRRLHARYVTAQLVRITEVCRMTGLSRTTIWRLQRARDFPRRVQISRGAVGWHLSDIEEWMRHRSQPLRRVRL